MNGIKKYILIIVLFLVAFCLSVDQVKALEEENDSESLNSLVGDINNDGIVDKEDAFDLVDEILDDKDVNEINDVNNDKELNINDVTNILYKDKSDEWDNDVEITDEYSADLSKNNDNIYIGDEVEVGIEIKGFNENVINGIEGTIDYNKDRLELINIDDKNDKIIYGNVNEDNRFIYILDDYDDESSLLKFRFKAKELGFGIVSINNILLSYDGIEVYSEENISLVFMINNMSINNDSNKENVVDDKNSVKIININNNYHNVVVDRPVFAISDSGKKISVSYVNISSDNAIKELIIKNHKIDFEKDKLEYDIVVDGDTNKLDMIITLNDDKAIYEIIGNEKFKVGNNKVYIIVTAEDGSIRKYIINVEKKEKIKESNSSRNVIIILLVMIIIGLMYIIFKDDEDEDK